MPDISRRGFLSTAGMTTAGVAMVAVPGLAAVAPEISERAGQRRRSGLTESSSVTAELNSVGPLVVHVRDAAAGELSVLSGETEVMIHDPGFVAQIVTAAGGRAR